MLPLLIVILEIILFIAWRGTDNGLQYVSYGSVINPITGDSESYHYPLFPWPCNCFNLMVLSEWPYGKTIVNLALAYFYISIYFPETQMLPVCVQRE